MATQALEPEALLQKGRILAALFLMFMLACFSVPAAAQSVPPELASLAAQLYEASRESLEDEDAGPAHKQALERARALLKKAGISNWRKGPVAIPGLAEAVAGKLGMDLAEKKDREFVQGFMTRPSAERRAMLQQKYKDKPADEIELLLGDLAKIQQDILAKTPARHAINGDEGESVEIEWRPERGDVLLRARSDGSGAIPEYDVSLVGQADMAVNTDTGAADVTIKPVPDPKRVYTTEELDRIRASIIGEWTDEYTGDSYTITALDKAVGDIRPPKSWYDEQIRQAREHLRQMKNAKEFVWEDPGTGEIIRQKRFRRLKEPYVYKGENPLIENAKERIAEMEAKISALEAERDGKTLPPVDKHDPVGFKKNSKSNRAKPIHIKVVRKDGHVYSYDQASFDGREIAAKRTYKKIEDVQEKLPMIIREQLIASWSPPGWLGLDASLDPVSGNIRIEGARWSLHVTYSAMFGDYEVSSIHTPYEIPMLLKSNSGVFKMAWGAADHEIP